MRYYVDGFRPGDPDIKPAASNRREYSTNYRPLPETVDVLIAGTGPAGLCLAAQLAQFPDITTLIVESDPCNIRKGKADGLNTRTLEMLQAFGIADKLKRESYWVNQTSFWMPDPENPNHIKRIDRLQDVADDSSEMPHVLINQARLHELFLDEMKNSPSRLEPDYNWSLKTLEVNPDTENYPVIVTLEDNGVNWGQCVNVKAKYVVGCDGARSKVRKAIGGSLHGEAANKAWGVMDILANTDFPDVRQKCVIASANAGNILILPREGGFMFRVYVELDKLGENERVANRGLGINDIIARASSILAPYSLHVKEVVWWSIYEIGQRITDRFDDVPVDQIQHRNPRVFTAGDACHTHSPKAGQGMNVSMQDSFNLGWKLAHVLQGRANASLLHSYSAERRAEAQRLIDKDHEWSRTMSTRPDDYNLANTEPEIVKQFKRNLVFTGGLAVQYEPSNLTGDATYQQLAQDEEIGRRFHSAPVVRFADAKQLQLGHIAEADGRWRIYVFARENDHISKSSHTLSLADWLGEDTESPVIKYTRPNEDVDSIIDVRFIFPHNFDELAFEYCPKLLKPMVGKLQLQDHEKVFCLDHKGLGDIYSMRGIDRNQGCTIIVRPDQYIAHVLPLTATQELSEFFAAILTPQQTLKQPI